MLTRSDSATELGSISSNTANAVNASTLDHEVVEKQDAADGLVTHTAVSHATDGGSKKTMVDEEDGVEYPVAWRLSLILVALALCVFCMALVSYMLPTLKRPFLFPDFFFPVLYTKFSVTQMPTWKFDRITQSSPPLFPASPTNLKPWRTLVGMALPTC